MTSLEPGEAFLFMKVGTHANETLESIIKRKSEEISKGGYAMWGYGGGTCHPITMVRPFATTLGAHDRPIKLVMEAMESKHFAEQVAADQYSTNGKDWIDIDTNIHRVLGSRYALFIANLREAEMSLSLADTNVGLGPSEGRKGDAYVQGRVDKACLIYSPATQIVQPNTKSISLIADIVPPYAALLRNKA